MLCVMQSCTIRDDDIFTVDGIRSRSISRDGRHEGGGKFDRPEGISNRLKFQLFNRDFGRSVLGYTTGTVHSSNIWALSGTRVLANVGRRVFFSSDNGQSWEVVLTLPDSSPPKGVLPSAVAESGGNVYLCTYPLGTDPARIHVSDSGGSSWKILLERDDFRHFHGIYSDEYSGTLWANTGDRDSESAIGIVDGDEFDVIGRGSQKWRAVELAMTPRYLIWGKDATYAQRKEIFRLHRDEITDSNPTPVAVDETDSILFYLKTEIFDGETWVIGSTSPEIGIDSTAPPDKQRNTCGREAKIIASPASSRFEDWYELYSVERRRVLGEYVDRIPTTDAHIFIDTGPEIGVIANPCNTASNDGNILRIPPDVFDTSVLNGISERKEVCERIELLESS